MPNLAELREELALKSKELHEVTEQAGPEIDLARVTALQGTVDQKLGWIRDRHALLGSLGAQITSLENVQNISRLNETVYRNGADPVERPAMAGRVQTAADPDARAKEFERKGLGQMLREDKGFEAFRARQSRLFTLELPVRDFKALLTLTTVSPQAARLAPVPMPVETRVAVADLFRQGNTERNTIDYYEETTLTNAAAPVAEAAAKPESDIGWTLRTETVRKIGTFLQATAEVLDDVPFLEGQVNNRLRFFIEMVEDAQLLNGTGTAPALRGILQRTGIQTQAKGTDPTPDAIYKGMQKIRGASGAGFAEPTNVVMHPNDWTLIKLLRDTTGNYLYSGGPATEAGDFVWGLPVRQTTGITAGTALVGDFRFGEVVRRGGVTVTMSTEHASFFLENKVAILAEERLALAVYRPSAFCTITGVNV